LGGADELLGGGVQGAFGGGPFLAVDLAFLRYGQFVAAGVDLA
jgi:hypothetical protein